VSGPVAILFVGDVVGPAGRRLLLALLPGLRAQHAIDFVVVNGENAANGVGITPKIADALFDAGVDVITLGNHTYRQREIYGYLDDHERILRPANFLKSQPGHGWCVVEREGVRLGVVSLSGNLYMKAGHPAFPYADAALHALRDRVDHLLVDVHAEATSEKVAMGWHLDGRGTAYVTDVGMTGARGGVIGVKREQALEALTTQMPVRFEPSEADPWLHAVVIRAASEPLRADGIEQLLVPAPPGFR
jgi:2',3'-cyclic-nucleotide 2'-phosphodiesterase